MNDQRPVDTERGRGGAAFWTTLPGILTGLAAVITALVGLFTLLGLGEEGDNADSAPGVESDGSVPLRGRLHPKPTVLNSPARC